MSEEKPQNMLRYVEIMTWIKELSSPSIETLENADAYRLTMLCNFMRIGELSRINAEILDTYYFPDILSNELLSDEMVESFRHFSCELVNAFSLKNVDLPMAYVQAMRLLRDAEAKRDDVLIIRALDDVVVACYAMMDIMLRIAPCSDAYYRYRDEGLAAAMRIIKLLEPSRFTRLPNEETKETVLINARYIRVLFEGDDRIGDEEYNEQVLQLMRQALLLAENVFYKSQVPSYNWLYHNLRTLEYISSLTDHNNLRGCTPAQIREINEYTHRMIELVDENPDYFDTFLDKKNLEVYRLRNAYLAGETTLPTYRQELLALYHSYDKTQFLLNSNLRALHTAYEYILTLDDYTLTPEQEIALKALYDGMIAYMHQLPKTTSLSYMISCFSDVLKTYREIPDGMDFETFGLNLMAAIHPPTYVHSVSVADFSTCLTRHLLEKDPALFVGMPGYNTVEDVKEGAGEIIDFVYHAALCHDFGKLIVIDAIMTYGRRLLESDLEMIRVHPAIGAYMLNRFEKTRPYAAVAQGHHRWYDNSDGYPDDFDMVHSPYRTVISIVACADCLDASTDAVGRSYKKGISLDQYLTELHAGSGTRYAPYLSELLADCDVRADIERILATGRDKNYREVWHILRQYAV